jgi:pantetheine-phosphate adenylyltransferase
MFKLAGLGGTFDHLHEGHKLLISTALNVAEKVVIGLTTDELLKNKKYASKLEDYETRKKHLIEYIEKTSNLERVSILELNDPYGPPAHEKEYEVLVASHETYTNAIEINNLRKEKGLSPLIIVLIPILKDKDKKISSTEIRKNLR